MLENHCQSHKISWYLSYLESLLLLHFVCVRSRKKHENYILRQYREWYRYRGIEHQYRISKVCLISHRLSPDRESNPEPSDIKANALTIRLPPPAILALGSAHVWNYNVTNKRLLTFHSSCYAYFFAVWENGVEGVAMQIIILFRAAYTGVWDL